VALIREPAVARWWGGYDTQQARRDVLDGDAFVIEWAGQMIGVVLVAEENEPDYRHCGLDIAIATAHQGQGLGRAALGLVIEHLVHDRGHHRLTIDPAVENERAIRCYTALGFRPVGVMRAYERRPDGKWRDGLLMELIAREP
jgi:aminoglycoside 6'-N-acetyltransferase